MSNEELKERVLCLFTCIIAKGGHAVAYLVEELCYKSEGRGMES
jgi:hypothetical protein